MLLTMNYGSIWPTPFFLVHICTVLVESHRSPFVDILDGWPPSIWILLKVRLASWICSLLAGARLLKRVISLIQKENGIEKAYINENSRLTIKTWQRNESLSRLSRWHTFVYCQTKATNKRRFYSCAHGPDDHQLLK